MKYLKRDNIVNAFKINEENLFDIIKELLVKEVIL